MSYRLSEVSKTGSDRICRAGLYCHPFIAFSTFANSEDDYSLAAVGTVARSKGSVALHWADSLPPRLVNNIPQKGHRKLREMLRIGRPRKDDADMCRFSARFGASIGVD